MNKNVYIVLLHLFIIGAVVFGVNECTRANRAERKISDDTNIFNKANEIIKLQLDDDSNTIVKSIPNEETLSEIAMNTKNLLDSASGVLKLPRNERITTYTRIPIQSSYTAKATKVTDELAETENDNWYMSYSFKDSVFNGRYKTIYNHASTTKENKFLGIQFREPEKFQYDWVTDKGAVTSAPTSVVIKEEPKTRKLQISNVNKFRNFDNSVLSGAEVNYTINRITVGGEYNYNFNTTKPEYEVKVKFNLFK